MFCFVSLHVVRTRKKYVFDALVNGKRLLRDEKREGIPEENWFIEME